MNNSPQQFMNTSKDISNGNPSNSFISSQKKVQFKDNVEEIKITNQKKPLSILHINLGPQQEGVVEIYEDSDPQILAEELVSTYNLQESLTNQFRQKFKKDLDRLLKEKEEKQREKKQKQQEKKEIIKQQNKKKVNGQSKLRIIDKGKQRQKSPFKDKNEEKQAMDNHFSARERNNNFDIINQGQTYKIPEEEKAYFLEKAQQQQSVSPLQKKESKTILIQQDENIPTYKLDLLKTPTPTSQKQKQFIFQPPQQGDKQDKDEVFNRLQGSKSEVNLGGISTYQKPKPLQQNGIFPNGSRALSPFNQQQSQGLNSTRSKSGKKRIFDEDKNLLKVGQIQDSFKDLEILSSRHQEYQKQQRKLQKQQQQQQVQQQQQSDPDTEDEQEQLEWKRQKHQMGNMSQRYQNGDPSTIFSKIIKNNQESFQQDNYSSFQQHFQFKSQQQQQQQKVQPSQQSIQFQSQPQSYIEQPIQPKKMWPQTEPSQNQFQSSPRPQNTIQQPKQVQVQQQPNLQQQQQKQQQQQQQFQPSVQSQYGGSQLYLHQQPASQSVQKSQEQQQYQGDSQQKYSNYPQRLNQDQEEQQKSPYSSNSKQFYSFVENPQKKEIEQNFQSFLERSQIKRNQIEQSNHSNRKYSNPPLSPNRAYVQHPTYSPNRPNGIHSPHKLIQHKQSQISPNVQQNQQFKQDPGKLFEGYFHQKEQQQQQQQPYSGVQYQIQQNQINGQKFY